MRLATFNMLHGRSVDDGLVHPGRFAEAVSALDADVLALQEVDRHQKRSEGADFTAIAAEAMGAHEHRFVAALAGTPGATWAAATGEEQPDSAAYGIALLSRYPVLKWHVLRLGGTRGRIPMKFPGRRWPVLIQDEPRVALIALVETPLGPVTVATTHLSFVLGYNTRQLWRLMRELATWQRPVVLMGDLNMGPRHARRATGMRSLVTAHTFRAPAPHLQLDHILLAGELGHGPIAGAAVELPLSDHRALEVVL